MRPLPADTNDFSCAMAEKSLLNDVALMVGAPPAAVDPVAADVAGAAAVVADELDLELLLHAASPPVNMAMTATTLARLSERAIIPPD